MSDKLRAIEAEEARRDFRRFIRAAWHVVEPGTPFIEGSFVDAIADHLVALLNLEIRNLIINIAPRHSKSSLCSVMFPAWVWLQHPEHKFLTSSYSYRLAMRDAVASRRLITSPWYRGINIGDDDKPGFRLVDRASSELKHLKDLESFYQNDRMGHRIAVGVGGSATGHGGDSLICDDSVSPMQAASDTERRRANDWWDHTMSNRGNDPKTARRCVVMQRLHTEDLTGHLLAKDLGYTHLFLPERFNPKRICVTHRDNGEELYRDARTEAGELLWPERFGRTEIDELAESMGVQMAAGQLDQEPVPDGGLVFKEEWIKRWTILPTKWDRVMTSWDLNAGEATVGGSYVVGQKWGLVGPDLYLIDLFRERCDYDRAEDAFVMLAGAHPKASEHLVEDKAAGRPLISRMRKRVPGIRPVKPSGDKVTRAKAITGFWRSGNVLIPPDSYASWVRPFVDELVNFPNAPADDQIDSMSQILAETHLGAGNDRQLAIARLKAMVR